MDLLIDEVPKPVSSLSSSGHLEVIEELVFKDQHILTQIVFPSIFVEHQPLHVIDDLWQKMDHK